MDTMSSTAVDSTARARDSAPSARHKAFPCWPTARPILKTSLTLISGKSDFAKANRFGLNRWEAHRLAEDGRLEMTNNAPSAIRPLTLGLRS